ncbi:hypothetical protein HK101_007675 [Irineochytrium annulatum]|nr:hypothetical protein HK101_007675 [Irineochytrium annulatum]
MGGETGTQRIAAMTTDDLHDPASSDSPTALVKKPASLSGSLASYYEPILDTGYVPDFVLRRGIRHLLSRRKQQCDLGSITRNNKAKLDYVRRLRASATIAINTKEANEQHYEVPTAFFKLHLGARMKYSSCLYEDGAAAPGDLDKAEEAMLDLYVERAGIEDGMDILELGCGWGSLSLYLAERFKKARVTGVSNSRGQREYIMEECGRRGIKNLEIITADINTFQFEGTRTFDRVVSIEMFEHMKNFASLFEKVSRWIKPDTGRLFVHVFAHKSMPYDFKKEDDNSWMAKYFFTGGTMPSEDLFMFFQQHLTVLDRWTVDGRNYGQTAEDWLARLDACKVQALPILEECYGSHELARVWFQRWRIFYLSVAELFNYDGGQEWCVVHYLFKRAG